MKTAKSYLLLAASFLVTASAFASPTSTVLEKVRRDGPGLITQDIKVNSDGNVTESHRIDLNTLSSPVVVTIFTAPQIKKIQALVDSLTPVTLVQLDSKQHYNPSGMSTTYTATNSSQTLFTVEQIVSGVEFGLPNRQGQDVVNLLNSVFLN